MLLAGLATACVQSYVFRPGAVFGKRERWILPVTKMFFLSILSPLPLRSPWMLMPKSKGFFAKNCLSPSTKKSLISILRTGPCFVTCCIATVWLWISSMKTVSFFGIFSVPGRKRFLLPGKLNLEIKKLGVVKEVKDERGISKNTYAAVQLWEMK